VDVDDLLARAGGLLRTGSSITLAVVGNALKAFPGFGTLGGGIVHAVAYGLIFDSLGHALADTLAHTRTLDRDATVAAFQQRIKAPSAERLLALAKLALAESGNPHDHEGDHRA
ncbi:MAG: GTP-binding protein HSR1, partial [Xanthomonadales bacterium]|nr:GTP-binding protein HSR1 [Xanthomonadales bacterium]